MFADLLATGLTAVANAYTAHEHNVALRMLTENGTKIYEAKAQIFKLEDAAAPADARLIDLANLKLQFLEEQQKRILSSVAATSAAPPVPPGGVPASGGAGDKK